MEGLVEECDGTGPEAPLTHLLVAVSSHDDGRHADVRGRKMPEEVEAGHSGHPQVEHEATGVLALGGCQELFRRGERLDSEAYRPQEIPERATQRFVIVHDVNRRRLALGHAFSLSLSERRSRVHLLARLGGRAASVYPTLVGSSSTLLSGGSRRCRSVG